MDENSTTYSTNNKNILSIAMVNTEENPERCNKGHKLNKYHDEDYMIYFTKKQQYKKYYKQEYLIFKKNTAKRGN